SSARSRVGPSVPCSSIAISFPPESAASDRVLLDEGPHLLPASSPPAALASCASLRLKAEARAVLRAQDLQVARADERCRGARLGVLEVGLLDAARLLIRVLGPLLGRMADRPLLQLLAQLARSPPAGDASYPPAS